MRKVLYVNGNGYDYLADSFLIGLKQQENLIVYEWPVNLFIYKSSNDLDQSVHGKGFTLCNVIDQEKKVIFHDKINIHEIDIFIFGSIHRQFGFYLQLLPYLKRDNTIILDGEDSPAIFPYSGFFWRKPYFWLVPKPHKRFLYFKRELIASETSLNLYYKLIPRKLCKYLRIRKTIREISFSIPLEKIVTVIPKKLKLFATHIVDEEIAGQVTGSYTKYAFDKEEDYYADLQFSKFGITTKRAGWDCMRHYEIAANGAVICFKNLEQKPSQCAPHGLVDGVNCLSYKNYSNLISKIEKLSESGYINLLKNSLIWVSGKSSKLLVSGILNQLL